MILARPQLPLAPLAPRAEAAAVLLNDETVIIWGGMGSDWQPLGDGALLHLDLLAWEPIPEAPGRPRERPAAATDDGLLFVCGGIGRSDGAVYDRARRAWEALPSAPLKPRINHVLHAVDGTLLVWGGDDGSASPPGPRPYVDGARLDLSRGNWSPASPYPLPSRAHPSRVWCGDQLVVWGGVKRVDDGSPGRAFGRPARRPRPSAPPPGELQDAAIYDVETDAWTVVPHPPPMSSPSRAVAARGRIVLVGLDGSVVEWEPLSGRTVSAEPLPANRAALAEPGVVVSAVGERVFVLVPEGNVFRLWSNGPDAWREEGVVDVPVRASAVTVVTRRHLVIWGGFTRERGFTTDGAVVQLEA